MKTPVFTFTHFIERFEEIALPVTLTEESMAIFSRRGEPLPDQMVRQYIAVDENAEFTEYQEYFSCFKVPDTHGFHAVVYWQGDLMKYHFVLATYDIKGKPLAKAVIGGLESDGANVLRSVVTIEDDWVIHIVEGDVRSTGQYDPVNTRAYQMELLATGEIVMLVNDAGQAKTDAEEAQQEN